MLDYCISKDRRSGHANEDWFIEDKCECEPVHFRPVRELTRHKKCSTSSTSLCSSSAHECESLDGSGSATSTHTIGSDSASEFEAEEIGIFEFEF